MAWAAVGRKIEGTVGGAGAINITLNSTVAGNFVAVGTSCYNAAGGAMEPVVTDGGNTWTKSFTKQGTGSSNIQAASLSYSILGTGGNRTINSDPGASTYDMWANAEEFSDPNATPASGTPATGSSTGTAGTTSDTSAMTPADNDVLVIAVEGHTAGGTVTENSSPGDTGFTLSNDHESGSSAEPGSMVYKIISGSPGTPRAAWTIPSSHWACGIAAFKPSAAGGTAVPVFYRQRQMQGMAS